MILKYRLFDLSSGQKFLNHQERLEKTYTEKENHVFLNDPCDWADPYETIQANSVGTDIYEIIGRALNGDSSVDFSTNWEDLDCSLFTLPLLDMQEKVNSAKRYFSALPLEIKERFGNDFGKFAASYSFNDVHSSDNKSGLSDSNVKQSQREVEQKGE